MFLTLPDRTDCFCGSGSRIGIHITLYKPPSPVICLSFHTSKMTGRHQEQLIDHLRVFWFLLSLIFYCTLYFQGTEDSRTQHLPSQHHHQPHPHHPEREGSHRRHLRRSFTNFSKPLEVGLKLAVTLTHLSAGESYTKFVPRSAKPF